MYSTKCTVRGLEIKLTSQCWITHATGMLFLPNEKITAPLEMTKETKTLSYSLGLGLADTQGGSAIIETFANLYTP